MIYTLTLNPALDYDIYLDTLKVSELNPSNKSVFRAGGKGINVSIMLKNLSIDNEAICFIGGFTGKFITDYMDDLTLKSKIITISEANRINIKINDKSNETEIAGTSPTINEQQITELFEYISQFSSDDILILSGSINKGLSRNIYKLLSKQTKAKVILDTRGSSLLDNIHNNLLIKPNIKELEEVFDVKINNDDDIYKYSKQLINKGIEYIMVSMGSKGACLIKDNKLIKATIPSGTYINSIGAGDSTVAGFVYAYINNKSDIEKLKMSVACGSSTAYSYGIGTKKEVDNLIENIKCEEIIYEY